jgi:hypothetical protein
MAAAGVGGLDMYFAQITEPTPANGAAAAGTIAISFLSHVWGVLPALFAIVGTSLGIVFYCLTIYQMEPVRAWRMNRAARKRLRLIADLKARERIIVAELAQLKPSPLAEPVQVACPFLLADAEPPTSCPLGAACTCAADRLRKSADQ